MERIKLSEEQIKERLLAHPGWCVCEGSLRKRFAFANFAESLDFVNRVGAAAEAADHHPDIKFGWGFAEFELTTHDRGGITDFDLYLAGKIDALAASR